MTALMGVDFTSAPTRRKPVAAALGRLSAGVVRLERIDLLPALVGFEALLRKPGPWLGAFDFPFGLPRAFVASLALGTTLDAVSAEVHRRCVNRMAFRALIDTWGNNQPAGQRLLHRATDGAMSGVTSTSPLQTRYVPVGFMYFEGVARLVDADVTIPQLRAGSGERVAVEAYPGLLAHALIGRRSYKNQDEPDRLIARKELIDALEQGRPWTGLRLRLSHAQRDAVVADASGDRLDAVLCLMQAAWASTREGYGLPAKVDAVEGWIVTA